MHVCICCIHVTDNKTGGYVRDLTHLNAKVDIPHVYHGKNLLRSGYLNLVHSFSVYTGSNNSSFKK